MSITVVSTMSKTSPAATVDGVSGKFAARDSTSAQRAMNQDFADLLLGKLPPPPLVVSSEPALPATTDEDTGQPLDPDAAVLVAALGLPAAANVRPGAESPVATAGSPAIATVDAAIRTTSPLVTPTPVDRTATDLPADDTGGKTGTLPSGKPQIDDKSAIIAASSSTSSSSVVASTVSSLRPISIAELPATRGAVIETTVASLPAPAAQAAPLAVTTPVRDAAWATDFADKIVWMASNDKQSARLTLNPAHLGPLEISLNIDKGHATAAFVSASAEVRDALETALPRLREMFASAGIALGQTNVSAESFSQQAGTGGDTGAGPGGAAPWAADNAILVTDPGLSLSAGAISARWGNGMVDTFA